MFRNYFKTAWRSINRYKAYSIINVLGLTLGIASCLIIFLVVKYELGYDSFNKKADRIYRVTLNAIDFNPSVSMAVAPALRVSFPELEQVSQVWYQREGQVMIGQKRYHEKGYAFADAQFAKIFDYQWISGDPHTALAEPNAVVLTETMAKKYFGSVNPMGQTLKLDNRFTLKVTGLMKDAPGNTNFPFNFLVSFETVKEDVKGMMNEFYAIAGGNTYILAPEHYNIENMRKRIPAFIAANWGNDIAKDAKLLLQPLREIHFDQRYLKSDVVPTTSRETYWALSAVAVFIIIIACINFINLATAQAIRRAKEVGVRKVLGSNRSQLVAQFLGETLLMVLIALTLGLLVTYLFLPEAAKWMDIKISMGELMHPSMVALMLLLMIGIVLLAGLYPAFVQSAFRPVDSLKSKTLMSSKGLTLRKGLVVIQFAASQIMIIGTLVVAYQMDFFQNRDLGFDKDAVISIDVPDLSKTEVLRQQLVNNPGVKDLSFASGAPAYGGSYTSFTVPEAGITKDDVVELKFIDEHYTAMFKLTMLAGEPVVKKNEKDTTRDAVVNETLMQKMNITDPAQAVGKHFLLGGAAGIRVTIRGVMQDFQSESKHKKRRPCILIYQPKRFYSACVKLQPVNMDKTIAGIDKAWSALFPDQLFNYEFLDDHIANWYRQEQKEYTAFKLFSGIAILIGCLGLYGLVAFAAAQRIKEVGIRKVLGASMPDIILLFSKEFVWLIAIAFCIAAPVAYYTMSNWLRDFAYSIPIGPGIFITAIVTSFVIAGFTIAYQAIKAAMTDPVKSLRSE